MDAATTIKNVNDRMSVEVEAIGIAEARVSINGCVRQVVLCKT